MVSVGYSLVVVKYWHLIDMSSLVENKALGCPGFSSCGAWAYLPPSMWNLPRTGIEPTYHALAVNSQPPDNQGSPVLGLSCGTQDL